MIETLHTILTDDTLRSATAIETLLAEKSSMGVPWFDEENTI